MILQASEPPLRGGDFIYHCLELNIILKWIFPFSLKSIHKGKRSDLNAYRLIVREVTDFVEEQSNISRGPMYYGKRYYIITNGEISVSRT